MSNEKYYQRRLQILKEEFNNKIVGTGEAFADFLYALNDCSLSISGEEDWYYIIEDVEHIHNKKYKFILKKYKPVEYEIDSFGTDLYCNEYKYSVYYRIVNDLGINKQDSIIGRHVKVTDKLYLDNKSEFDKEQKELEEKVAKTLLLIKKMHNFPTFAKAFLYAKNNDINIKVLDIDIKMFVEYNMNIGEFHYIECSKDDKDGVLSKFEIYENRIYSRPYFDTKFYSIQDVYDIEGNFIKKRERYINKRVAYSQEVYAIADSIIKELGYEVSYKNGRLYALILNYVLTGDKKIIKKIKYRFGITLKIEK